MGARFRLAALFGLLAFPAMAQTPMWVANATLSPTTTLSAGHLCATDGRDIYCDGSLPIAEGLGLGDRIVSGTSSVTVNSATGVVSLTQAGTTWGYLHPSLGLVAPGVSSTGTISGTKVIAGSLIAYSFGGEGGQLTLGYANTLPTSEVTATWNIDVSSNNSFRIFRRNASTTAIVPFVISESTGWIGIGGVSNPSATLHVLGKMVISSNTLNNQPTWGNPALLINNAGPAAGLAIGWNAATGQGETDFTNYGQGGVGGFNFYNAAANGATFAVTPTLVMQITSSGMVSATRFVGDGSGLTNLPGSSADRLTSGSSVVTVNSATGIVSLTQAGSTWAYLHPSLGLVAPGVSATGPISGTDAYFAGNVGIGTIPEVALHVSGTLRAQGPVEEAVKGIPRIDIGVQASTPRMVFEPVAAVSNSIWEVDNLAGRFRWFNPGIERMYLTASSTVSILGAATHAISNMDASNTSVALILRGTSTTEGGGAVLYGVGSTNIYAAIKGAMRNGAQNSAGDIVFATRRSAADPSLTETLRVTAEGNVGIGTPSPSAAGLVVSNTMAVGDFNGGTAYPAGRLMVYKIGGHGSPAASGSSDTAVIVRLWGGSVALDYGVMANGNGWLQQRRVDNLSLKFPLLLNPNGGAVAVGLITPSAVSLEVSGTVSATRFVGDGSGLTNISSSALSAAGISGSIQFRNGSGTLSGRSDLLVSNNGTVVFPNNILLPNNYSLYSANVSGTANIPLVWNASNDNTYLNAASGSLVFLTSGTSTGVGTERMRIGDNGSVGIGTVNPNPAYALDVSGPMVIRGSNSGYFLIDRSGVSSSTIYRQSNRTRFWDDLGGDRMVIDNTTGNVGIGIGTSVPAYRLHVSGTAAFYPGNAPYPVNLYLLPTGHATSQRVALNMDRWNLIQDGNGTGLKDFSLYDAVSATQRFFVNTDGRTVFPWTQQLIVGPWQNTGSSLTVVNGEIQPGSSGAGCASGNAGAIRYASGALTYCTGSVWAALASSGTANVMALSDLSDVSKSVNNLFLGWINGANANVTNTVAVGPQVFGAGTNSGFANVALGNSASYYNTTGRWNSAVGNSALMNNTTGDYNTIMGFQSGIYNTTGNENTALGAAAAYWNDTGSQNTSIGRGANRYNVGGSNNTLLGHTSGQGVSSSTAFSNVTAAGYRSLFRITTGNDNTAIGAYAGQNVSSGSSNTLMGYNAGLTLTTGSNNILIGNGANVPTNSTSDYLNIGNTIYSNMSNNLVGIGVAAPSYALEVQNATQYQGIALRNAANTVFRVYGSTATNDSGVLQLLNSGTVAMRLSAGNGISTYFNSIGGNVGIGTATPTFPLTVSGNAVFGGPSSGYGYTMAAQGLSGNAGYTGFHLPDGTRVGYIGWGTGSGGTMDLATDGNTGLRFITSGTDSMRIDAVGNVGIGVTSMSNPLEVRRDQNASTDVSIRNSSNLANAAARMLLTADVGSGVLTYNGSGSSVSAYAGGPSGLGIWATGSGGVALSSKSASGTLRFYTGTTPSERARIDASGNVGINTNAPAATLDVNGYMKLAKNGAAPVACGSTYDGSIALTSARRMCVCDGSSWKEMNSATACTW